MLHSRGTITQLPNGGPLVMKLMIAAQDLEGVTTSKTIAGVLFVPWVSMHEGNRDVCGKNAFGIVNRAHHS